MKNIKQDIINELNNLINYYFPHKEDCKSTLKECGDMNNLVELLFSTILTDATVSALKTFYKAKYELIYVDITKSHNPFAAFPLPIIDHFFNSSYIKLSKYDNRKVYSTHKTCIDISVKEALEHNEFKGIDFSKLLSNDKTPKNRVKDIVNILQTNSKDPLCSQLLPDGNTFLFPLYKIDYINFYIYDSFSLNETTFKETLDKCHNKNKKISKKAFHNILKRNYFIHNRIKKNTSFINTLMKNSCISTIEKNIIKSRGLIGNLYFLNTIETEINKILDNPKYGTHSFLLHLFFHTSKLTNYYTFDNDKYKWHIRHLFNILHDNMLSTRLLLSHMLYIGDEIRIYEQTITIKKDDVSLVFDNTNAKKLFIESINNIYNKVYEYIYNHFEDLPNNLDNKHNKNIDDFYNNFLQYVNYEQLEKFLNYYLYIPLEQSAAEFNGESYTFKEEAFKKYFMAEPVARLRVLSNIIQDIK